MTNLPCADQPDRARSFDVDVPFTLEQVPQTTSEGEKTSSWKHAIFVVHGIGAHEAGVTAVGLRNGFEDAMEELRKACGRPWKDMPATYIKEGYWGDYGDFKDNFPTLWVDMNQASRKYFEELWKKRAESYTRTALWYAWQSARLPWKALTEWGDSHKGFFKKFQDFVYRVFIRLPLYVLVIIVSWVALVALLVWPRGRRILSTVLGDVRLYVAPNGPGEQAIRQNIDRRVRDLFLQMLGLGYDAVHDRFTTLPAANFFDEDPAGRKLLRVGSVNNQKFEKITWVSHSLGTVVSYNVIADLLCKCETLSKQATNAGQPVPDEIKRIEAGLYRFYTLGSPLRKINWLFPNNMRPWPAEYFEKYILPNKGLPVLPNEKHPEDRTVKYDASQWWLNFRHIWDPVSGPVNRAEMFRWAGDWHSPEIVTLPGVAHVGYWHTDAITKYILAQTHPNCPGKECAELPRWPQFFFFKILWQLSMMFFLALVAAIAIHAVELVGAKGIHYATPWWDWLVTVPVLGPVLQLLACWVSKILCWVGLAAAFLCHWAAGLSAELWNWLSNWCGF
jgi:hypothetical protein